MAMHLAALLLTSASFLCEAARIQAAPNDHQQPVQTRASLAEFSANNTQSAASGWDLYCNVGSAGLNLECAAKGADCAAGTWNFKGSGDLAGKIGQVQCLKNPPLLAYGKPTCNKLEADDRTTYVYACDLCFASTSMCFHWMVWVSVLLALMLFCCCGVACCCCKR
eukprot:TRINITY_DN110795_c0_g1_i1.p1 TRINITY_DN110795_c0_g1~~TRINITY_DN110795_c0_g1_i1.p1  ORF type:complete len:188 (-),score=22.28 TRINITY_DN110795_c0_g1_i1:165-662(-)